VNRLIVATTNSGKVSEIESALGRLPGWSLEPLPSSISSIDETGATFIDNAIQKAGAFLTELGLASPREVVLDDLPYRTVTSVTLAQGGRGRNIVPDRFTLNVNHRFAPDTSLERAEQEVEELVRGRAEVRFTDRSPAALPFAEHPLVVALRSSGVVAVEPKQAWTDVARFAQLGVAAVNFGPGEQQQAHQRNEWTSLAKLETGADILMRWLTAIERR